MPREAAKTLADEPSLSAAELADFKRDGYVIVKGMFDAEDMARITLWTDEVTAFPETLGRHMVYYEDSLLQSKKRVLSRIENFCPYHNRFNELLTSGPVLRAISDLFGELAVLFKDKINYKMPGGDGFKAHQDVQAGWDHYAPLHITTLISIDEATQHNGFLEVAPGAHDRGLLGDHWKPLEDDIDLGYVSCPTQPGDAVFFDSFVPHRSGANLSATSRRILYLTYNRASEGDHRMQYYIDKRASYPPDIERDPNKDYVFRV